jgi:hypothetical protein
MAMTALSQLNVWLVPRTERNSLVPCWQDLRLVGADATTDRFVLRARHVGRTATAKQIAFGRFCPGAELMPAGR